MANKFTLYSRPYCHLCDDLVAGLRELLVGRAFELTVVDVDSDPALAERYGLDVPVLLLNGVEVCRHRLAPDPVLARLSS